MTPTEIEERRLNARRWVRHTQSLIPWISLGLVGVAIFLFFNLRANLIECNAEYQTYTSNADQERLEASVAKGEALDKFILDIIPIFTPGNDVKEGEMLFADLQAFEKAKAEYAKARYHFPQKDYSEFCPVGGAK